MKIVDWKTFCDMPEGTIFSRFEPNVIDGLYRKGETLWVNGEPTDFFETLVIGACWNGELPPVVDDTQSRYGCYDNASFAVYEQSDITAMVRMLIFDK